MTQGKKPGQQAFSQNGVMSTCGTDVTHYVFCCFARRDADTIPNHVWRGRRIASLYVYSVVDMFQYCLHMAECSVIVCSVIGMFRYCLHRAECSVIVCSVIGMFQCCLHGVWKQRHCSQSSRRVVVKLSSCTSLKLREQLVSKFRPLILTHTAFRLSWCFTSTETEWLNRDGESTG